MEAEAISGRTVFWEGNNPSPISLAVSTPWHLPTIPLTFHQCGASVGRMRLIVLLVAWGGASGGHQVEWWTTTYPVGKGKAVCKEPELLLRCPRKLDAWMSASKPALCVG